jgi:hypothetical protein
VIVPSLRVNRKKALPRITEVVFVLFILFLPTITWSQSQNTDQTDPLEYAPAKPDITKRPRSRPTIG